MSPTARSLAWFRKNGFLAAVVEKWNPHAMIRQDVHGFGDILASHEGGIYLVQVTSRANMSARRKKIEDEPRAALWKAHTGRILLMAWSKKGPRGKRKTWTLEQVEL